MLVAIALCSLAAIGADLVLTALPRNSRALLTRTGALALGIREFDTLDAGLEWIEAQQLATLTRALEPRVPAGDFRAMLAPHFTARARRSFDAAMRAMRFISSRKGV